jgi:hypothetical protein
MNIFSSSYGSRTSIEIQRFDASYHKQSLHEKHVRPRQINSKVDFAKAPNRKASASRTSSRFFKRVRGQLPFWILGGTISALAGKAILLLLAL